MGRILGDKTWLARGRMAVKIWTGEVLRLIQLLNELHGEVTQAIMVKLELLLSSSHIHIANIVNGHQMAVATSLLALRQFKMAEFGVNERESSLRVDVSDNLFCSRTRFIQSLDVNGHPITVATVVCGRRIKVKVAATVLRREQPHLDGRRIIARNNNGMALSVGGDDIPL